MRMNRLRYPHLSLRVYIVAFALIYIDPLPSTVFNNAFSLEVFIMVAVFLACVMVSTALFSLFLLSFLCTLAVPYIHLTLVTCNIHPH
jgi:hypothetical protein